MFKIPTSEFTWTGQMYYLPLICYGEPCCFCFEGLVTANQSDLDPAGSLTGLMCWWSPVLQLVMEVLFLLWKCTE